MRKDAIILPLYHVILALFVPKDHLIHQVLNQALDIISNLSKGNYLYHECKKTLLNFPEVKTIRANEKTFTKIPDSRKTAPYKTALAIARLIILNYAPNITKGSEQMLALLFDMNSLWEEYILVKLKQCEVENIKVFGQRKKLFWNGIYIKPDIIIETEKETIVIDTKWKIPKNRSASVALCVEKWSKQRSLTRRHPVRVTR